MEIAYWASLLCSKEVRCDIDYQSLVLTALFAKKSLCSKEEFLPFCAFFQANFRSVWEKFESEYLHKEAKENLTVSQRRLNKQFRKLAKTETEEFVDFNYMVDTISEDYLVKQVMTNG